MAADAVTVAIKEAAANPAAAVGTWVSAVTIHGDSFQGQIFAYQPELGMLVLQGLAAASSNGSSAAATPKATASNGSSNATNSNAFDFHVLKLAGIKLVVPAKPATAASAAAAAADGGAKPTSTSAAASPSRSPVPGSTATLAPPVAPVPLPPLVPITHIPLDQLKLRTIQAVRAEMERNAKIGVGVDREAQDIFDALAKTLPATWKATSIFVMDEVLIDPPYTGANCRLLSAKTGSESTLARVKKVLDGERRRLGLAAHVSATASPPSK
ncbi:anticodon-binding domain-containing protein [Entophlyctis helioformis]|nr:anticodon-binding domain-containing protein [Entophlyctis helioformis]